MLVPSCGMQDLSLWLAGCSLVVAHGVSSPMACGILAPQSGVEPAIPARQILNLWTTREVHALRSYVEPDGFLPQLL